MLEGCRHRTHVCHHVDSVPMRGMLQILLHPRIQMEEEISKWKKYNEEESKRQKESDDRYKQVSGEAVTRTSEPGENVLLPR